MDGKLRRESADEAEAGKAASAKAVGLGLVLVGAAALVVSVFLPLAQPADGIPIVGNNNLFQELGWHVLWIPLFLAFFGYQASQGKQAGQVARWCLIGLCAIAAVGIVWLATDKDVRTLHLVGPNGAVDTSQPGLTTSLGIAIYVAGAAVAVAFVGALALFQSAGRAERLALAREIQLRIDAQAQATPEGNPEPEQAALEAESSAVEVEAHAAEAQPRAIGSLVQSTWPLVATIVVVVATVAGYLLLGRPPTSQPSTTSQTPPSLTATQTALEKLLLSPDQINTAMGNTGLTVAGTVGEMIDVAPMVSDKGCQPIASPAGAEVYEGSGWSAVVGQVLMEPGNTYRHAVDQFVVSFPSSQDAGAFFTASAQQWQACANRQYTNVKMGQELVHTVGPISNTDGTLSVTQNQKANVGFFTCQRALTVAGKVVIDVAACSLNQSDAQSDAQSNAAVNIAHQIATNGPTTQ